MAEFVGGRAYADRSDKYTCRTDKPIQSKLCTRTPARSAHATERVIMRRLKMELAMPHAYGRPSGISAWSRYAPPVIALLVIVAICLAILQLEAGKLSEPAVGLVRSLVWPSVLILTVLFFRQQAEVLFANLNDLAGRVTLLHDREYQHAGGT